MGGRVGSDLEGRVRESLVRKGNLRVNTVQEKHGKGSGPRQARVDGI